MSRGAAGSGATVAGEEFVQGKLGEVSVREARRTEVLVLCGVQRVGWLVRLRPPPIHRRQKAAALDGGIERSDLWVDFAHDLVDILGVHLEDSLAQGVELNRDVDDREDLGQAIRRNGSRVLRGTVQGAFPMHEV